MNKSVVIGGGLLLSLIVVAGGAVFWIGQSPSSVSDVVEVTPEPEPEVVSEPEVLEVVSRRIGTSVEGRPINVFSTPYAETHLLFVGGIHGGYEWNSSLLAYDFIAKYLTPEQLQLLQERDLMISVIPVLNPDGLAVVTGGVSPEFTLADVSDPSVRVAEGRFNANGVDLNRNFDCKWAPESTWRGEVVSAGSGPFSEPEAAALRDFVTTFQPDAVVFWHSQANNVYASECYDGPLPATLDIMQAYADAGNYGAVPVFDAYPVTGDAEGWLASVGIPAITVELETFSSIEWERNIAGVEALLTYYGDPAANLAR